MCSETKMNEGKDRLHPTHKVCYKDVHILFSWLPLVVTYCEYCGVHSKLFGGWGKLALPCPSQKNEKNKNTLQDLV